MDARSERRVEVVAVLLISLTAVMTAWTSFQSAKWSGLQTIDFSDAAAARVEADGAYTEAGLQREIDVETFLFWLTATVDGEEAVVDAIEGRFSPFLAEAIEPWLDTNPLEDPDAPATPFTNFDYPDEVRGAELAERADQLHAEGLMHNQTSDNYTAMAIVFATVILFAALADKLPGRRSQVVMLSIAGVGLAAGSLIVLTFPITF